MPKDLSELAVGEKWGYQHKQTEPVTCVEVTRLGTGRPPRVQIKFIDDEHEGRQEWVPPGRLKVRWSDVDAWRENERRWAALRAASDYIRHEPEGYALSEVFDYLDDGWELATYLHNNDTGILSIPDADALAADLDLDANFVAGDPVSFVTDEGNLLVPWRVSRTIVERLASKYADVILPKLEEYERTVLHEARWGYMGSSGYIDAEICAEVDEKYRPGRDLVRHWCGQDAKERYDELVALRAEVVRLGKLAERAISALRAGGNDLQAEELERELGIPLEVLRRIKDPDQGP
ncbi:MAG TPA: hypothetical protein VHX38_28710 [Pseudonocardiaceae bacterium]|nr:hypothetical protein [Pseudonocardiaceae bacterium]